MFKLKKKTEYALLALHMMSAREHHGVTSVREIAERYGISDMVMAKVLQTLKRGGLATSSKGAAGGYRLDRPLDDIAVTELFALFGEPMALVSCLDGPCRRETECDIRRPLEALNGAIQSVLTRLSVAALFEQRVPQATVRG